MEVYTGIDWSGSKDSRAFRFHSVSRPLSRSPEKPSMLQKVNRLFDHPRTVHNEGMDLGHNQKVCHTFNL